MSCHRLDLNEGSTPALSAGSELEVTQVLQGNSEDIALSYVINDSSLSLPLVEATLLSASNSTLEIGQLVAQSAVTLVDTHLNVTQGKIDLGATGSLNLEGTSVVTHPPSDGDVLRKLHITGMNVIIGGDASIDLTGKGYGAFTTAQGSTPTMAPRARPWWHGRPRLRGKGRGRGLRRGHLRRTSKPQPPRRGGSVRWRRPQAEASRCLEAGRHHPGQWGLGRGLGRHSEPRRGRLRVDQHHDDGGLWAIEAQGGASTRRGASRQCPNTQLGGGGGGRIALTGHVLLSGSFLISRARSPPTAGVVTSLEVQAPSSSAHTWETMTPCWSITTQTTPLPSQA